MLLGVGCVARGGVFQSWSLWAGVVRFVYVAAQTAKPPPTVSALVQLGLMGNVAK